MQIRDCSFIPLFETLQFTILSAFQHSRQHIIIDSSQGSQILVSESKPGVLRGPNLTGTKDFALHVKTEYQLRMNST